MAIPPKLDQELNELKEHHKFEVVEDNEYINVIFIDFVLGEGYKLSCSDLLLRVPRVYPDAGPDMFWTSPEVLLVSGQVPQAAENLEQHLGRDWRRFSWHRASWNPNIDNMHGHIEFIRKRLREKK